ncbi:MAG: SDR family oxidoreductase [Phycisphaerae bacterium]
MDLGSLGYSLGRKRAIVCGSTQGIGRACALRFADLGAHVTLVARDELALTRVCGELSTPEQQRHEFVVADFTEPNSLKDRITRYLKTSEPVHILLNNTGGPPHGAIVEAKPEEFVRAISMHVVCNQILVQAVLPGMKQQGYGRVINIISTSVKEPIAGLGVSNTTRWAVASWAKTMAGELAGFGITVNNVLPGYTDTARLGSLIKAKAKAGGISEGEVARQLIERIPAGRLARPEEIAAAAGFLASPSASYITGINLPADGGRLSTM